MCSPLCDLKKIVIHAYTFDFNEWRIDQNECRAVLQNDERLCSLSIYFVQYLKADGEMSNCFDHCRSCFELSNCFVECAIWCSNSFAQLLNSGARCRSVLANDECWNRCSNSYVEWSNASAKRCMSPIYSRSSQSFYTRSSQSGRSIQWKLLAIGFALFVGHPGR